MIAESDPISADEYILRRILNDPGDIDLNLRLPVNRKVFRPTEYDLDGISLHRELFVTAEEVSKDGTNPKGYHVVRMPVQELHAIGISVLADPVTDDNALPGHCIIPDITTNSVRKDLQAKLAELVNLNIEDYLAYSP